MGKWVIVAIPEDDDPVWKISSEKVPHLTLLFLGEQGEDPERESRVVEFLRHVAETSLTRFGLSVDRRGELGADTADVVFFEKLFTKDLENARSYLLKNQDIYEMYHSTEQFPEWLPHLTLGYPETPAKSDEREYPGVNFVRFDRLALWTGDYQGEEVHLKSNMISDEIGMDALEGGVGMAAKTVQDVFDEMSEIQKDAAALLFGAIVEDDDAVGADTPVDGDKTLGEVFDSLSDPQKNVVDFIAGGIGPEVQHSDISPDDEFLDDFLEHFGVKGMRWGQRKDRTVSTSGAKIPLSKSAKNSEAQRREARLKVKQNKATLEESHIAGLKSTGHRVANGALGDKTFWKRNLGIAGATAVAAYGSMVVPGLLPSGLVNDLGGLALGSAGVGLGNTDKVMVDGKNVSGTEIREAAGHLATVGAALATTATVGAAAVGVNAVSNVTRAVRGNARISKSYRRLGEAAVKHQSNGNRKVNKVLKRNGSIKVKHDDISPDDEFMDDFLEHYGIRGMRWGIRRRTNREGVVVKTDPGTPSGKSMSDETAEAQKSADFERAAKAYAKSEEKGLQALSNEEIKAITNRVSTEKSFRALSEPQKNELQRKVDQLRLEKEYRQLQSDLNQKKVSTGRKIVGSLVGAAATAANNHAASIGKTMIEDMLGIKKQPTLKDKLAKKNDLMRTQKENAILKKELADLGISTAAPSSSGTPFRVNPDKVKISRT